MINVLRYKAFDRAYKKLHNNQKIAVNRVIDEIIENPLLGESKVGDLVGLYVYKFQCVNQLFLLAYKYDPDTRKLVMVGTHENFYRDLKKAL